MPTEEDVLTQANPIIDATSTLRLHISCLGIKLLPTRFEVRAATAEQSQHVLIPGLKKKALCNLAFTSVKKLPGTIYGSGSLLSLG